MNSLNYDYFTAKDGIFYSLDMIRMRVRISERNFERLNQGWCFDEKDKIVKAYPECYDSLKWRYFYQCIFRGNHVLKMGFRQNDARKEYRDSGFIEFILILLQITKTFGKSIRS